MVPAPLDTGELDPRDAALAHAIHDTVIRRWWTLQAVVAPLLSKPFQEMEPGVRAALLGGAAQLLFFDRIPPHAAISESVEWTKRAIRPGAGGLVNAVLRRVTRLIGEERSFRDSYSRGRDEIPLSDGRAIALLEPVFAKDKLARISAAASIAKPLLESWREAHGDDRWSDLALHTLAVPPVVFNIQFAENPVPETEPHSAQGFARYIGPMNELGGLLDSRRDFWVQDAASGEAVGSVADLEPEIVLDLCAGKGTKTRQLERTFPSAQIIATDTDAQRLDILKRAFPGADGRVRVMGFPEAQAECKGRADLILLDVPCSNTGVLARRPEAKYRGSIRQTDRLVDTQRQIIAGAIPLLSEGGKVLYSTCSLQPEEDQMIAKWAQTQHNLSLSRERLSLPAGLPGESPRGYCDGSYSVLLSR